MNVSTVSPTVSSALDRPPVWPVLQQHLEDAAFCWLRRDAALWLPTIQREHLARTDRLLDAHLLGLRLAGAIVLPRALAQLQRWKTADEVFVTTYAALHAGADDAALSAVERVLRDEPGCVRGAAAALLWAGADAVLPLLQRWWKSGDTVLRRAALPAALRHPRVNRDAAILDALDSAEPLLMARALRAIGEWRLDGHRSALEAATRLDDVHCRLESAYALRLFGFDVYSATTVDELATVETHTRRRILLSMAATAKPARLAAMRDALVHADEPREALWLQIFRGDGAAVEDLLGALDGEFARLAAYGLQHITGCDIEAERLWLAPDPNAPVPTRSAQTESDVDEAGADDPEERIHPEDAGLLPPDAPALRAWFARRATTAMPLLAGRAPQDAAAFDFDALTLPQHWQSAFARTLAGEAGALTRVALPLSY